MPTDVITPAAPVVGFEKPLSSKYLRVAKKKAHDAAVAEALAKGEEPPVLEKPTEVVAPAVAKKDEGSPAFEVDEELRKKAVNTASVLARRVTKKAGGKKVSFKVLVEGELRKLIKQAGGSDAAATAAIESERKRFAAMKKDAPAAPEEVGGEVKMTCRQKKKADYDARQLKLKESGVIPAVEDTKKDGVAPTATDANNSSEVKKEAGKALQADKKNDANNAARQHKPKKQEVGGKKAPKYDMRGLNKKQKKEKQALEEAAKKAGGVVPTVRVQLPLHRGNNQQDKPDPASKRTERRMQRAMPEIVKGVLPSNSFMSSETVAQLGKKEQPAPVAQAPAVPKPQSFVAPAAQRFNANQGQSQRFNANSGGQRPSVPYKRFNPKRTVLEE